MSFFTVSGLTAGYGGAPVVNGVSFEVEAGSLLGILGANGSGKTTLLKAVCGILPHEGSCVLETENLEKAVLEELPPRRLARLCGYIPQRSGISIDISVLEAVLMGFNPRLKLLEYPSREMKEQAREALQAVGLGGREEENYQHLSEGQKQLCILARTLAAGGRLLLLDEPESALDFRYRYRMLELLKGWLKNGDRAGLALLAGGEVRSLLRPGSDSLGKMEAGLSELYGPVSLRRCQNRSGREQLVMLKEEEGRQL